MAVRTYLDTGVIIAAWSAVHVLHSEAVSVLKEDHRDFVSTSLSRLETIPHAKFGRRIDEVNFLEAYFQGYIVETHEVDETLVQDAERVAEMTDTGGIDAMHIAAAINLGAEEFITVEKRTKPMYRNSQIRVIHLADYVNAKQVAQSVSNP